MSLIFRTKQLLFEKYDTEILISEFDSGQSDECIDFTTNMCVVFYVYLYTYVISNQKIGLT